MSDGSPERVWRAALAEGRVLLQRATSSGNLFFPPRLMEPRTGDSDWEWMEASGIGTVHSVTWVNQKPPAEPYNVVLVDLDEGVRLMSRVDGVDPAGLTIGLRVRARIATPDDGEPVLLFEPA